MTDSSGEDKHKSDEDNSEFEEVSYPTKSKKKKKLDLKVTCDVPFGEKTMVIFFPCFLSELAKNFLKTFVIANNWILGHY